MRNKAVRVDTSHARRLGVLVGAIGVATLFGGCDTRAVPDAPAESGTTPATSASTATIAEWSVSIPETVGSQAAGGENESDEDEGVENAAGDGGETITDVAPVSPPLEQPATTVPARAQCSENDLDENDLDENDLDENEPDENEPYENEPYVNDADECGADENDENVDEHDEQDGENEADENEPEHDDQDGENEADENEPDEAGD